MSKIKSIIITSTQEGFAVVARRDNYEEVGFSKEDVEKVQKNINSIFEIGKDIKTNGEKLQEQKNKILDHFIQNTTDEEKQKNLELFDKWKSEGTLYKQDSYVVHHGILYICMKQHYSDYESIPALDTEHWKKAPSGKERNPKLPKEKPDIYNNEKTYRQGEYCIYNSKVYKYIGKTPTDGESPFSAKSKWEEIGEWED